MRDIRYQAAVVDGTRVLLETRTPDGREEVQLDGTVERLLDDMAADPPDGTYSRWRTYLCRIRGGGEPRVGHEETGRSSSGRGGSCSGRRSTGRSRLPAAAGGATIKLR